MFQGSITKITKCLLSVSMAAVLVSAMLFAACTPKEKEKEEDDPLKVTGGEVTKGGDGANTAVTEANLNDFIKVFLSAINSDYRDEYSQSGSAPRGKRSLPDEYSKWSAKSMQQRGKLSGDSSGYVEVANVTPSGSNEYNEIGGVRYNKEGGSITYKLFDFSNTGKLFLGGAVGFVGIFEVKDERSTKNEGACVVTEKYNGKINFKGEYEGKVVFDNLVHVEEFTRYYDDYHDVYTKNETSGKFYVESNGNKIDLPDSLLWDFIYPNSNKDEDYGDDKITLNTNVAVPAAPSGTLSDHTGDNAAISADNVLAFFAAFMAEFADNYRVPRAVNEFTENGEELKHGKVSGYVLNKSDYKDQTNNSGEYSVATETMAYNDYSNEGRLYFGGGYGKLVVGFWKSTNSYDTSKDTTTLNGKVKFNGEFAGTLDFQSFKYEYKQEEGNGNYVDEYNLISGKVMIGSYDATQKYLELVIRRN